MPYRQDVFVADNIYHIYNRSVDKMPIFVNPENYTYLLHKVKQLQGELPMTILA